MFDLSNPNNPFIDWNFVFIPYCTGDYHLGSKDMIYEYVPGEKRTIHHRGHDNFLVVLKWMTDHFKHPHEIFITGSSAGSHGAIGNFPWIMESYPQSKMYVLGDSGMGIYLKEVNDNRRKVWNVQLPEWIFGENPPAHLSSPDIWKAITKYYPHSKFAAFSNAWDKVQIVFYNLALHTVHMPPAGGNVCTDWNAKMLSAAQEVQKAPNFRSYIAPGRQHIILITPQFYTKTSAGVSFLDWLNAMMDRPGRTNNHKPVAWENVKCTDCDAPKVCQYH